MSYDRERQQNVNEVDVPFSSFGMFSRQGGQQVYNAVRYVVAKCTKYHSDEWVADTLRQRVEQIAERYGEVHDTAVREEVVGTVNNMLGSHVSIFDVV